LLVQVVAAVKQTDVNVMHAKMHRPRAEAVISRNFSLGTEPHLEEVFMGRCYAVQDDSYPPLTSLNCTRLWTLFSGAFRYKDDSKVGTADFDSFFSSPEVKNSLTGTGKNALFWSGVQDIVAAFQTSCHLFVMETSPLVAILNELMFCGSDTDPSGFNYEQCVYGDTTPGIGWRGTWVSFWAAASAAYAPTVTGNITLLFSGDANRPAYRRTSFFGSIEMPRLNPAKITGALIWVAPESANVSLYEHCGEGSLKMLFSDLVNQGLDPATIECRNNPRVVRHLQCALQYTIPECQFPPPNSTCVAEMFANWRNSD